MFKKSLIFLFSILTLGVINAQANLLSAVKASDVGVLSEDQISVDKDEPLKYGYVADRDILWSKIVWEEIDLTQKFNFPYYFPKDNKDLSNNRLSLFNTLITGIETGEITEVYRSSYFKKTEKFNAEDINSKLNYTRTYTGKDGIDYSDSYSVKSEGVTSFMIKGMWFFDKRQGELKYRMLGIAPLGADVKKEGSAAYDPDEKLELFWVFFPDARKTLHNSKVFNPENSANPISFDHILNSRRFSSFILREQNVYADRPIRGGDGLKGYVKNNSLFQLLESERIKEEIRNKEIDMWNY